MIDLDELRAFLITAERGGVNRAARELRLTQPAVSRRIQRLEAALGVLLFNRKTRPPTLTLQGEVALHEGRALFRAFENLRHAVAANQEPSGRFRIGIAQPLAESGLATAAAELTRRFAQITFRLTTGWGPALLEALQAESLDFAVTLLREGQTPPTSLVGHRIGDEQLICIAPRETRVGRVRLAELAGYPWILNPEGCGFRTMLERDFAQSGKGLRVAVEVYGHDVQLELVARGIGLSLVPASILRRSRFRMRLHTVRITDNTFQLGVWSVRRADERGFNSVADVAAKIFARLLHTRHT